jgi:large subunit ribosomal protein L35
MPKNKTHKGTKKRIKRAFGGHLLTKKSSNRKRKIRKALSINASDQSRLRDLLGR